MLGRDTGTKDGAVDSVKETDVKDDPRLVAINKGESMIHKEARKRGLVEKLKNVRLTRLDVEIEPVVLAGPYNKVTQDASYGQCFATALSTYPHLKGARSRDGDPICDSYRVHTFQNGSIMCLCDGCGWFERPRQASNRVKDNFVLYMTRSAPKIRNVHDMAQHMINALAFCHYATFYDKEDIGMAGFTTCIAGAVVQTSPEELGELPYNFTFVTIGDCKAFRFDMALMQCVDLTPGNRMNLSDSRDPGGRLGPWDKAGGGSPDLRNLDIYSTGVNEGDLILLVSDGVHDNFDPQMLGKTPAEVGLEGDDWNRIDEKKAFDAKTAYMNAAMTALILSGNEDIVPSIIAKKFVRHCRDLTAPTREFMEQNSNSRQPETSRQFPGKLDHVSLIVLQVGKCVPGEGAVVQKSLNPLVWPF